MSDLRSPLGNYVGTSKPKEEIDRDILAALEAGYAIVNLNDPLAQPIAERIKDLVRRQRGVPA